MNNQKIKTIIKTLTIALVMLVLLTSKVLAASNEDKRTEEQKADQNSYLKRLEIKGYELYPSFNKFVNEYFLPIPSEVTELEVEALPEIEDHKVEVSGNTNLTRETGTITIVSHPKKGGTKTTYKVNVSKQISNGLYLTEFKVSNGEKDAEGNKRYFEINPDLNKDAFKYDVAISMVDEIKPIDFELKTSIEGATVEVIGNENLKEGINNITILLTDDSGNITTYALEVKINLGNTVTSEVSKGKLYDIAYDTKNWFVSFFSDEKNVIITLVVAGVILLLVIILIVRKIRRSKRMNEKKEKLKHRAQK
jgi:hypothetical protein